jgi:mono/diheme cytochrome c family protein
MPVFALHGAAIAQGLVREHGYGPQDEAALSVDPGLAVHGERLLAQGTGFNCVQCHAVGDKPAVQVFEREGIELLTARARLRHEYFARWLADPPRMDPDSRMPKFQKDGKTAITDVLDGDAAQQFEAIWHYLGGRIAGR